MDIYQHFRPEEYAFIDQVMSWRTFVERSYQKKLTDFLDPREQQIMKTLVGTVNDDLKLGFFGGGKHVERKRAIIAPFYDEVEEEHYECALLQATFNEKFNQISHRDVLGSFLSLGLDRKKIGDIFVHDGLIQMIITEDMHPYVIPNLTRIKRTSVSFEQKPLSHVKEIKQHWVLADKVVSSLRLDVIIKDMYGLSRKVASQLIEQKSVKVNFKLVEDVAYPIYEGDLISVRGKGRGKLVSINGETRKGRLSVTMATLK